MKKCHRTIVDLYRSPRWLVSMCVFPYSVKPYIDAKVFGELPSRDSGNNRKAKCFPSLSSGSFNTVGNWIKVS